MKTVNIVHLVTYLIAITVYIAVLAVYIPVNLLYQLLTAWKRDYEDHLNKMAESTE